DRRDNKDDRRDNRRDNKQDGIIPLPVDVLTGYIQMCRRITPVMSDEGMEVLRDEYCMLRGLDNGKSITATTRQLESMIRLSEAHARMRMSKVVEGKDVREVVSIIKESMLLYAIDPISGKIDMDVVISGRSRSWRESVDRVKKEILGVVKDRCCIGEVVRVLGGEERLVVEGVRELDNEEVLFYDEKSGELDSKEVLFYDEKSEERVLDNEEIKDSVIGRSVNLMVLIQYDEDSDSLFEGISDLNRDNYDLNLGVALSMSLGEELKVKNPSAVQKDVDEYLEKLLNNKEE
ncbi:DNA replication licensing factor Mcm3, partial [Hamiltosporidium tvaerminnensis]